MRRTFFLLALLLTSPALADNIDDLRGWPANGLPVAGEWAGGHELQWQADQSLLHGHRLIPAKSIPFTAVANNKKAIANVDQLAIPLKQISEAGLPLILRDGGQIAQRIAGTYLQGKPSVDNPGYRGTSPEGSAVCWAIDDDGKLVATSQCDVLAPPGGAWTTEGRALSRSLYLQRMQVHAPNVAWLGYWDNNEIGYPKLEKAYAVKVIRPKNDTGPVRWKWKTPEEVAAQSVTMRDHIALATIGWGSDPVPHQAAFYGLRAKQYEAFYAAMREGWNEWADKPLVTVGYSADAGERLSYDGVGPSYYIGWYSPYNLLSPDFDTRIKASLEAWAPHDGVRVVYLWVNGKQAVRAASEGTHEVITPAVFSAYCEWLAWSFRKPGTPVLLEHWVADQTKPTDPFFRKTDGFDAPGILRNLKRDDLLGLTEGAYSIAPAVACDRICSPAIRPYWLGGDSIQATTTEARARVVAVKLGERTLVNLWSPCKLGVVPVTVDGKTVSLDMTGTVSGYWTISGGPGDVAAAEQRVKDAQAALEAAKAGGVVVTKVEN